MYIHSSYVCTVPVTKQVKGGSLLEGVRWPTRVWLGGARMGRVARTKRKTNGLHKVSLVGACGRLRGELWCYWRSGLISRKGREQRQVGIMVWSGHVEPKELGARC